MKAIQHKIDVTCALELNARDIELLECLTSYSNEAIVKSIFGDKAAGHSISYNGGVSFDQMTKFLDSLRSSALVMKEIVNTHAKNGLIR